MREIWLRGCVRLRRSTWDWRWGRCAGMGLALHDFVTVTARQAGATRIVLKADHKGVPRTETGDAERNTAWKMVAGALERMGICAEVEIGIEKRLPVQGGMGAGSANAVAALLGLERELGQALPEAQRLRLAAEVGSDVPLFLMGGTVLGLGRGEEVYPLPDMEAVACVVAVPEVGVSTGMAFRALDERSGVEGSGFRAQGSEGVGSGAGLTSAVEISRLRELSCALASVWMKTGVEPSSSGITRTHLPGLDPGTSGEGAFGGRDVAGDLAGNPLLALVRTGIENDFEEVVFSQHPSLRSTKRDLVGSGKSRALYAALSGSGSALFGLYGSQADAREAQQRVQLGGTKAFLTQTCPRKDYWHTMFAE
jgi:4-diphosphocytidyl-2-C-methyl-D-erythritol kinase